MEQLTAAAGKGAGCGTDDQIYGGSLIGTRMGAEGSDSGRQNAIRAIIYWDYTDCNTMSLSATPAREELPELIKSIYSGNVLIDG
jgi:hypothetical protein